MIHVSAEANRGLLYTLRAMGESPERGMDLARGFKIEKRCGKNRQRDVKVDCETQYVQI